MLQRTFVLRRLVLAASVVLLIAPARAAVAADDLTSVLAKLDAAADRFHSATADVTIDNVETDPIPNTDTQKGTVDYQRNGTSFEMGVHLDTTNGQPAPKIYVYSGGTFQLYEGLPNQLTRMSKLSGYDSWFMLGFGASGKDLAAKWQITYAGSETIDGVQTAKLVMIPKDQQVLKYIQKATLWMDTERGVSLQQRFDEGAGSYRACHYTNIKLINQALPKEAFTLPTNKSTTIVNR